MSQIYQLMGTLINCINTQVLFCSENIDQSREVISLKI